MTFIIGEIGTNHMGDINIAKRLIDLIADAGFDAVKFQKKDIEKIYTKEFLDSPLDSPWGITQREMRIHREFGDKEFRIIDKQCKKRKIPWHVSCWDVQNQIHMRKFKTKFNKVASAMLVHKKLLETVAEEKKYTFISTGMSTLKQIDDAVKIFRDFKCPFELMHSNSVYPMDTKEANLKLIPFYKRKFKCKVGYSGHESGASIICVAAVLMGATSIERHITLDRTFYGHDQAASLAPHGFQRLIRDLRLLDIIQGDGKKRILASERLAMEKLRQKFV